jgi:hypothetical protein
MPRPRRIVLLTVGLAVLVTGVTLGGVSSAAAASDTGDGILSGSIINSSDDRHCNPATGVENLDGEVCRTVSNGVYDAATYKMAAYFEPLEQAFASRIMGQETTPVVIKRANETQSVWNSNSTAIESEYNDDVSLEANRTYVVGIGFQMHGEETERYLVAETNANGTATTVMQTISENRTVSETLRLCGFAADQAPAELRTFISRFVLGDETPGSIYEAHMKGRYGAYVSSSMYPTAADCNAGDLL